MTQAVSTVRAVVRAISGDDVIVEVEQGGCGRCHEAGGCGGQHLTQMMCVTPRTFHVRNSGARVGDHVTVAIASHALARGATMAYIWPLTGLLGGAAIGMALAGDLGALAGAASGLVLAWLAVWTKLRVGQQDSGFSPYLVDRP